MAEIVEILVDEDGNISAEGQGFHGPKCEKMIDAVMDGFTQTKSVKKKEFYEKPLKEKTKARA